MNIVTGMHRSGTSFLANLLHNAGCDFGDTSRLLEADDFNSRGYFENKDVLVLNDKVVLGELGYSEKARLLPRGSRAVPLGRAALSALKARYLFLNSTDGILRRGAARREQISALGAQLGDTWVKDPRFSLTIGLWQEATAVNGLVYIFRHPAEVALSLQRRERLPLWLGLRTWAFHVEAFLAAAPLEKVTLVDFNRLRTPVQSTSEIARLAVLLGYREANIRLEEALAQVLDPSLLHHRDVLDSLLSERSRCAYNCLRRNHEAQP